MNKTELIKSVANETGLSVRDTTAALNAVLGAIVKNAGSGKGVSLTGLGVFFLRHMPERDTRNPMTGEKVHVGPSSVVRFRASAALRTSDKGAGKPAKTQKADKKAAGAEKPAKPAKKPKSGK